MLSSNISILLPGTEAQEKLRHTKNRAKEGKFMEWKQGRRKRINAWI